MTEPTPNVPDPAELQAAQEAAQAEANAKAQAAAELEQTLAQQAMLQHLNQRAIELRMQLTDSQAREQEFIGRIAVLEAEVARLQPVPDLAPVETESDGDLASE